MDVVSFNAENIYAIFELAHRPPPADCFQWSFDHVSPSPSPMTEAATFWQRRGFSLKHWTDSFYPEGYSVWTIIGVPWWLLVLASAVLPARAVFGIRATRRRRATGRCLRCGYDLRASAGRCPECGTPITSKMGDTA
jgi:hypothetical protein